MNFPIRNAKDVFNASTTAHKDTIDFARLEADEVLARLSTCPQGLTAEEAEERLDEIGLNEIVTVKKHTWVRHLVESFVNPFSIVLMILAAVNFVTDYMLPAPGSKDLSSVIVIAGLVTLSGVMRFVQESRSDQAAEKLKAMITTTATVERDGVKAEVLIAELVPGDIVHLAAGDMIPADLRVLASKDLFISQSSLTGESEPVEKIAKLPDSNQGTNAIEMDNLLFMGTTVVSGSARTVVVATGENTCFASMVKAVTGKRVKTSFDKGVSDVSWVLIGFMVIMVPVVFLVNGIFKHNWLEAFLFAISIAVGMTPEMLPMIVTVNLGKGAVSMCKKKTVVKNINSIQNFGAMDILCTDKTGTLTEDKIILERYLDIHGNEDLRILRHGYLNSFFQTGLKNLMDIAILQHGDREDLDSITVRYAKVDEIPFDFSRRRMSVVLQDTDGKTQIITKGAVEEMVSISSHAEYRGIVVELTDEIREELFEMVNKLNNEGMRVIAVAQKTNPMMEGMFSVADESDMVLMGFIGFLDPPKVSAADAVRALSDNGVQVKVLTGDNDVVASHVCEIVGIPVERVVIGHEVESMTDQELSLAAEEVNLFAKLSPQQKARIIKLLRENGHVVGYMGDGINDAAAMKEADVGISVDTAVDIAKESADIILLEKDLMVLEEGVIEGRKTFGNIIKYIKMTASSNFGNMFSVLVASAFLPFLPMLPIHILVLNMLYDISQIAIPWDHMDPSFLKVPRKWDASSIKRFMLYIGPTSSVFDIVTYVVLWTVFRASGYAADPSLVAMFHTGWFIESLISQTLVVHLIRTEKTPFFQSRAAFPVMLTTLVIMGVGIALPFTPLGSYLGFVRMPGGFFPWLLVIMMGYMILCQVVKVLYRKKFQCWL